MPLVVIPLAVAGCGGSGGTSRSVAGVKHDLTAFAQLLAAGSGKQACSRYLSPVAVGELNALGGCAKVLNYEVSKNGLNVAHAVAGFTATVHGNNASYQANSGGGTATYVGGHWVFSANGTSSSTSSRSSADAGAEELARTAQVAAETYATDQSGTYTGLSASVLHRYESTIQIGPGGGNAYIAARGGVKAAASSYTVTVTAGNGTDTFSITRTAGAITRSCQPVGQGNCAANGTW